MHPIQMQECDRGIGMGYMEFIKRFEAICQDHLHEGRARAFAFIFYDMTNGVIRQALSQAQGFRLLHEKTGKDTRSSICTPVRLRPTGATLTRPSWKRSKLKIKRCRPAWCSFACMPSTLRTFRSTASMMQTTDPVLVVVELEQYVNDLDFAVGHFHLGRKGGLRQVGQRSEHL